MISPLEAKIRLFIIKCQMKKDLIELGLWSRMEQVKQLLGEKFKPHDPYGEEDWDD